MSESKAARPEAAGLTGLPGGGAWAATTACGCKLAASCARWCGCGCGGRGGRRLRRDEIRAAGEHFDDVGDADFAEGLDRFDDAEFEVQAFVGGPFHAALGLRKDVDGGEDAIGRVIVGGCEQLVPEVGRDALAIGGGVEFGDEQGAQAADQFAEQLGEFAAAFRLLLDQGEGGGRVAGEQCGGELRRLFRAR